MEKINTTDKLLLVNEYWHPHFLVSFNGQEVLLSKMKGEFVFHHHDVDELFFVLDGRFEMHFPEEIISLTKGEFIIVPKGKEHKPVAKEEAHILLIHSLETTNTGNVVNELTRKNAPRI